MTIPTYREGRNDPRLLIKWNDKKMLAYLQRKCGPERGYMIFCKQQSEAKSRSLTHFIDFLNHINVLPKGYYGE